jgi:hypothetical protein
MEAGIPKKGRFGSGGKSCPQPRCRVRRQRPDPVIPDVARGLSKRLPDAGDHIGKLMVCRLLSRECYVRKELRVAAMAQRKRRECSESV